MHLKQYTTMKTEAILEIQNFIVVKQQRCHECTINNLLNLCIFFLILFLLFLYLKVLTCYESEMICC